MLSLHSPSLAPPRTLSAMSKRTRRSSYWPGAAQPPRLKLLRELRGFSQKDLAERAGIAQSQVGRIEIGETALTPDKAALLARALDFAPSDLYADTPLTVPLRFRVGLDTHPPLAADAPAPRRAAPEGITRPEECFAAEVTDDSADRLGFPRGSIVFARPPAMIAAGLALGDRILVGVPALAPGDAYTQVLLGEFQPNIMGDLLVQLRSTNRAAPAAIMVREGAAAAMGVAGIGEAPAAYTPGRIGYTPRDTDNAEILGRVEAANIPVLPFRPA